MFDKQEMNKKELNLIVEKSHNPNVDHISNTNKIQHVPARVSHNLVPVTNTDRRPRMPNTDRNPHVPARVSPSPVPTNRKTDRPKNIERVPPRKLCPRVIQNNSVPETDTDRRTRVNPKKIAQVPKRGESKCERKPAEMTIPSSLSHIPNGTAICISSSFHFSTSFSF